MTTRKTARNNRSEPAAPSRGPVDAPGKRHRKPLPSDRIDKQMGEPVGKKMGQKARRQAGAADEGLRMFYAGSVEQGD